MSKDRSTVRASDVGSWTFCNRAWWLARIQKVAHRNPAQLKQGNASHLQHGQTVRRADSWQRCGRALIVFALCLVLVLVLLSLQ